MFFFRGWGGGGAGGAMVLGKLSVPGCPTNYSPALKKGAILDLVCP